jgi:hypothetical protein
MGIMPGAGLNKEEVKYRHHEKCFTCNYFYYPNSCEKVDGNISPDAVCNKWEMKPPSSEGKDGSFYKEEYDRVRGES